MTLIVQDLTQPNDPIPLVYPELIDWDNDAPIHIPTFHDDEDIINFLCSSNEENNCFIQEFHTHDFDREGVKSLS